MSGPRLARAFGLLWLLLLATLSCATPVAQHPYPDPEAQQWQPPEETRLQVPPEVVRSREPIPTELTSKVPSYRESPVFYDDTWRYFGFGESLELVLEGKLDVGVMGIVDLQDFTWDAKGKSDSYWVAMENFRYLLPLVASDRPQHKEFVREWIEGWLRAHPESKPINYGSRDAMSVAQRAMTFVWYLRRRHVAGDPPDELSQRLRVALLHDQAYLRDHYIPVSNHGFWEAMGLFETTRVHPDSVLSNLALDRLLHIARLSFSAQGLHMEHSPAYHFFTINWVRQFSAYLENLEDLEWSGMQEMATLAERVELPGYFLYDHANQLAQIGDTDYTVITAEEQLTRRQIPDSPVLFDPESGYAAFKDDTRLALYTIQNRKNSRILKFHYHDDVLSVYYAAHGEVLLGDSGRYAYGVGKTRNHFTSKTAHSTFFPRRMIGHGMRYARDARGYTDDERTTFLASLSGVAATRTVSIPHDMDRLEIRDAFRDPGDWTVYWHIGHDVESLARLSTAVSADSSLTIHGWQMMTSGDRHYTFRIAVPRDCDHDIEAKRGVEDPLLGWYSPSQHVMVPATVLQLNVRNSKPVHIVTVIEAASF